MKYYIDARYRYLDGNCRCSYVECVEFRAPTNKEAWAKGKNFIQPIITGIYDGTRKIEELDFLQGQQPDKITLHKLTKHYPFDVLLKEIKKDT